MSNTQIGAYTSTGKTINQIVKTNRRMNESPFVKGLANDSWASS